MLQEKVVPSDLILISGYEFAGKIVIAGGGQWPSDSNEVLTYDISSGTYDYNFPNLNVPRRNQAGVFIPGDPGRMLVLGGWSSSSGYGGDNPPYAPPEYHEVVSTIPKPDIVVTPASLHATQLINITSTQTIQIINDGKSDLAWTLEVNPVVGWLSVIPTSGTVPPNGSMDITVSFNSDGLTTGSYTTDILVNSNDPYDLVVTVNATLTVVEPDIWIFPSSLELTLLNGTTGSLPFTIHNIGMAELTWNLEENPEISWLSEWPTSGVIPVGETADVAVTFDSSGLNTGIYQTSIFVNSDDPDEPMTKIDVTMNLLPVNTPPNLTVTPPFQYVGYSDAISTVTYQSIDNDTPDGLIHAIVYWSENEGPWQVGLPPGMSLSEKDCSDNWQNSTCEWKLTGEAIATAGTFYYVELRISDSEYTTSADTTIIIKEETTTLQVLEAEAQYSDSALLTAILKDDDGTPIAGMSLGFIVNGVCSGAGSTDANGQATFMCQNITKPAGQYIFGVSFNGQPGYYQATGSSRILTITPENTHIRFTPTNPTVIKVASPGGNSGSFSLSFKVNEHIPDLGVSPGPGDISLAQGTLQLVPVGPGSSIDGPCTPGTVNGSGYDAYLPVTCIFNNVPVNTYTIAATVGGSYYRGYNESLVIVYDPSLGYVSGGGRFIWPGTANPGQGYAGDITDFGFTMSYDRNRNNLKGNLLVIRYLADGSYYQVKSNALNGLSMGQNPFIPMGWASFTGKATYKEPGWLEPIGNYLFTVYVEDRNEPGSGIDRFWIQVRDKNGNSIPAMSLPVPGANNAVDILVGNIVVPHMRRSV